LCGKFVHGNLVILMLLVSATGGYCGDYPAKRFRLVPGRVMAAQVVDPQPGAQGKNPSLAVTGWGETHEDAEFNALKKAQDSLMVYFAEQNHPLQWRPKLDYINSHLVKSRPRQAAQDLGDGLKALGVKLEMEISASDWQYMLAEDRRVRADSRMLLLAKLLAGLVASLGAVAGYLRLEEMTKGYYTAWLRFAAVSFVSAVGVGIWWIS
jgi:hypothetical protein